MKILLSEFKEKFPKLILRFEKETERNAIWGNKITKEFLYWLRQKLKYRTLNCKDPNCPKFGQEFPSKLSFSNHIKWHDPEYRENVREGNTGKYCTDETKKKMSESHKGKKLSEETKRKIGKANFKEDVTDQANHKWIRIHYPPEEFCNNKCEICGKFDLHLHLARFLHINVRNLEDPLIDYMYICPKAKKNHKNSCHYLYDLLSDNQKEVLLKRATTRKEKLKRIREYVLGIKN